MKKLSILFVATILSMIVCNVKAQTIFLENFNNNPSDNAIPAGWTVYGDTLTNHPAYSQYNQSWQVWYPDGTSKSGEAMSVAVTTDTRESCARWLITPRIALPADSVMSLLFRHRCSTFGQFDVMVSTTGNDPADFTTQIGHITLQAEKNHECISLAQFAGDSIYIAFVNNIIHTNGSCTQFIALDDIEVAHLPENSVALVDVVLPEEAVVGQPVTAKLKMFNNGGNFVRAITYSYRINGHEPVVGTASIGNRSWRISEINVSLTPTELGEATIEFQISMPNGVADLDSTDNRVVKKLMVTDEPSVGIQPVEEDVRVLVHPNPTYGKVTLRNLESLASATITDMAGRSRKLRFDPIGKGSYRFDISSFPQGAYILTLTTVKGSKHTVRLIKRADF